MKFSQFCDTVENTEQEQQLLQFLKESEMKKVEQILAKMIGFPVIGNPCAAIVALINAESIAAFRQSRHYRHLMNMDFHFDLDKRSLYINPSDVYKTHLKKALAAVGIGIVALVICRKLFCRRNRR